MKEETSEWLRVAEHDMAAAAGLENLELWPGAAYFCQQAVEKLLRALLVEQDRDPPRIHDLVELADLARIALSHDQRLFLTRLSDHAVRSRYPGAEYGETHVRSLVRETQEFYIWLRNKLT